MNLSPPSIMNQFSSASRADLNSSTLSIGIQLEDKSSQDCSCVFPLSFSALRRSPPFHALTVYRRVAFAFLSSRRVRTFTTVFFRVAGKSKETFLFHMNAKT